MRRDPRDVEPVPQPAADAAGGRYVLCLFVTGLTPHSTRAVANLKAICEEHLSGRYDLELDFRRFLVPKLGFFSGCFDRVTIRGGVTVACHSMSST